MKFKSEKVNKSNMFSIGKDIVRDEYIMAITVCGIAWYKYCNKFLLETQNT